MSELGHVGIPADGWHGSRFTGGLDASKGIPAIAGQIYEATDTGIVYRGKADLSGWDILFYVGVSFIPRYVGVQTKRAPSTNINNNLATNIDHTSDTIQYDHGGVKPIGATFVVPVGYGGIWYISASVKMDAPSSPGTVYAQIQNSVGLAAGEIYYDGSITDTSKPHDTSMAGELELPAGATFRLQITQVTGAVLALLRYTIRASFRGAP